MDKKEILRTALALADLAVTEEQVEQFIAYNSLLSAWNEKMNLTAITDFNEVVSKHFIDSLAPMYADVLKTKKIVRKTVDVGTGAGFPGIPLKIMNPGMDLTLVDSLNKRVDFLNVVINELGLKKTRAVHARAEDFGRDLSNREKYDLCVSRAVADLAVLSEYCIPLLSKGGIFIAYKGGDAREEIRNAERAVKVLGGQILTEKEFGISGTDFKRTLVVVNKIDHTPKKFPRKAGMPKKSPIR